ncbi:MAG: M28 family peptidase [Candidatus Schekmanbacteria bacterium]|nr:M28 family peptidase [Candidatus Schekmanbacteria bacterium]
MKADHTVSIQPLIRTFFLCAWIILPHSSALADDHQRADLVARFQEYVTALAADDAQGRGLGSHGLDWATEWLAARLRQDGFAPAFGDSFLQPFQVKVGVTPAAGNELAGLAPTDWTPLAFSSSAAFDGDVVFLGYGIVAPEIGYDELSEVDLTGKVALMMRYEPQDDDPASPFDGRKASRWSNLRYRAMLARERGAIAVALVTGPLQDEGDDRLPPLKNDGPESPAGIPVVQLRTSVAKRLLADAGIDLKAIQEQIDFDLTPRPSPVRGLRLAGRVALQATYASTANVAGVIPGRGDLAREVIVIGAHYDHLGMGGAGSLRPNAVAVHNGADDNASGTAVALLAAATVKEMLASADNHRTVQVVLFSAEETGLAGSGHFVATPPLPLDRTVAMINLDMVGRLRDNHLAALGADSAPEWKEALKAAARATGLELSSSGDGYGPSDQMSFYAKNIPVVHLFTGAHEQYHTPDDDVALLNAQGAGRIAELTASLIMFLARGQVTPHIARAQSSPPLPGDERSYGAYLGSVPNYLSMGAETGGVLLADVRPGSPAELAGLRRDDRIVAMAGVSVQNLYDMTFVLRDHKPGETIDISVLRAGAAVALRATLGSRTAPAGAPATGPHQVTTETRDKTAPTAAPKGPTPQEMARYALPKSHYDNRPGASFVVSAGKPFHDNSAETHLSQVRQLTFGGENAEAYFSPDGRRLIFQATPPSANCDQQYVLDLATGATKLVSTGRGRTTCGYFDWPEADRIVYASTEHAGSECPPKPDQSRGYAWAVYDTFDLYEVSPDGAMPRRLTETPGYDAEATWCHRGGKLVFTSTRDGDLDLYAMNEAGDVSRLTNTPGYDGGAFFSPDCSQIVWRASRPQGEALVEYRELLARGLVRPGTLELFLMNADGTNTKQLTNNAAANFAPYFHPDGSHIIYSSNLGAEPREFDLWLLEKSGGLPERITFTAGFDGFPVFSPDGRWLVWGSNRAQPDSHDTNIFIARWQD